MDLTVAATRTGGTLSWTENGFVNGTSVVEGSGKAVPDGRFALGFDWSERFSLNPQSKSLPRTLSLGRAPLTWWQIGGVLLVGAVQIGAVIYTAGAAVATGVAGIASATADILIVAIAVPPPPKKASYYNSLILDTGAAYTLSAVEGDKGFGLVNQGSIAVGGSGDLSMTTSVPAALFSDLLPSEQSVYQCCNGLRVSGSDTEGGTSFTEANLFTPSASGSVSQIDVAVGYVSGVNSFYVDIDADDGGKPGSVLASFTGLSSNTDFRKCCGLVTISGISGLSLSAGTNYWLVVGPTDLNSTTWEEWNRNSVGVSGLGLYSTDGGQTWISNGEQTLGAFDILPSGTCSNLVSNGSFETGDFTGWTAGGNFGAQVVSGPFYAYPGAEDGQFYAVLGPVGSDGTLSQTLATTSGANYTFTFWFASVGDNPSDFSASWDGTPVLNLSNPNTGVNWTEFSFAKTGTGSDTISFSFRDDPADMALDNVSVCKQ